jgi:glutathione reductase (NADPH)
MLRDIRGAEAYGIEVGEPQLVWDRTLARVRQVIEDVHSNKRVSPRIREAGADLFFEGAARFVSANEVELSDSGRRLEAKSVVLCIGGHSRRLPFPGAEHALYPEQILQLEQLPRSVVIVGSGYTGVQLTTCMNAFGVDVTLLEVAPIVLPGADKDISRVLTDSFRNQGVTIDTGIKGIDQIEQRGDTKRLTYTKNDQQHTIECEAVILSAGWPANIEGTGLEEIGVETERSFIKVNEFLQTSVPHIFVAGDANGQGMLVQGAHFEAYTAAENAVKGPKIKFKHELLPSGGFTDPDHAGVGLTEDDARKQYSDVAVAMSHYADLDRAIIDNRTTGFLKLIVDRSSDLVVGAHAAGENAVEVIQAVATAMAAQVTASKLASIELAYPTYTAIIGAAASQVAPQNGQANMRPLVHKAGVANDDREA